MHVLNQVCNDANVYAFLDLSWVPSCDIRDRPADFLPHGFLRVIQHLMELLEDASFNGHLSEFITPGENVTQSSQAWYRYGYTRVLKKLYESWHSVAFNEFSDAFITSVV